MRICQNRECRFGKIVGASLVGAQNADAQKAGAPNADAQMELNEYGQIAYNEWLKLSERFSNLELDVFQIMPNHMHGIIVLNDTPVGATLAVAPNAVARGNNEIVICDNESVATNDNEIVGGDIGARVNRAPTVGDIVGAYKSLVANACLEIYKPKNETMGKLWQRNYHEHIIRNEHSYQTISDYIINNPAKWNGDKFYIQ